MYMLQKIFRCVSFFIVNSKFIITGLHFILEWLHILRPQGMYTNRASFAWEAWDRKGGNAS